MYHINCWDDSHRDLCWRCVSAAVVALALLLCGAVTTGTAQDRRPNVLTTVAPLTNIVKNVGGPFIDLYGLIPGGMDSHTFEPAPSDVTYVAAADLIILNGLDLETPTEKLAGSASFLVGGARDGCGMMGDARVGTPPAEHVPAAPRRTS